MKNTDKVARIREGLSGITGFSSSQELWQIPAFSKELLISLDHRIPDLDSYVKCRLELHQLPVAVNPILRSLRHDAIAMQQINEIIRLFSKVCQGNALQNQQEPNPVSDHIDADQVISWLEVGGDEQMLLQAKTTLLDMPGMQESDNRNMEDIIHGLQERDNGTFSGRPFGPHEGSLLNMGMIERFSQVIDYSNPNEIVIGGIPFSRKSIVPQVAFDTYPEEGGLQPSTDAPGVYRCMFEGNMTYFLTREAYTAELEKQQLLPLTLDDQVAALVALFGEEVLDGLGYPHRNFVFTVLGKLVGLPKSGLVRMEAAPTSAELYVGHTERYVPVLYYASEAAFLGGLSPVSSRGFQLIYAMSDGEGSFRDYDLSTASPCYYRTR